VTTWALRTGLDLEEVAVHLPALVEAGLLGMAEDGGRAVVHLPARVDGLGIDGTWEEVAEVDWVAEYRRGLEPVTVGAIVVAPPWTPHDADAIVLEPGQAFGTGHHETTQGCLAALQELELAGRSVLDVGTGSGILAIAAARLGAERVVGVDTDPASVDTATANAAANGVRMAVHPGSADVVDATFDVVVANLDTDTLTAVAPELVARLAPGATFVGSGVSLERVDEAVAALEAAGLGCLVRPGREWAVLVGRVSRSRAGEGSTRR